MTTEGENYWASPAAPPRIRAAGPPHLAPDGLGSPGPFLSVTPRGSRRREGILLGISVLLILITVVAVLSTGPATAGIDPFNDEERHQILAAADIATVRLAGRACPGTAIGSGFVVDRLLFTSGHLVQFDDRVKVDRPGQPVSAAVLGTSRSRDVAVVDGSSLVARPLRLASAPAAVGAPVMLAGHPGGAGLSVVEAVVVGYQSAAVWGLGGDEVMLVDHETEGGFSGGPVLDRNGDVVAMLVAVDRTTGLTVAIPVQELSPIVALAAGTWDVAERASPVLHVPDECGDR